MTRFTLLALVGFALASASAYQPSPLSSRAPLRRLTARRNEPNSVSDGPPLSDADSAALARMAERSDEDATTVGSAEYYKGFVESPIQDDGLPERDPLGGLEQALKLGAGATGVLGLLTVGFMASNGLLG